MYTAKDLRILAESTLDYQELETVFEGIIDLAHEAAGNGYLSVTLPRPESDVLTVKLIDRLVENGYTVDKIRTINNERLIKVSWKFGYNEK
ncbi:MAG: hypothetical protein ACOX5F_11645 [Anaerovoracaceae bacterium]|jgi:hypothetical protein